ncbi:MAG: hypothetical protein M3A44_15165 [Gammaproteobacteria bacterium]
MSVKPHQIADFLLYARRPGTWLFAARRQMAVAEILLDRRATYGPFSSESVEERSGCIAAAYFHAGLAIENAAKAYLVHRDPMLIQSDGRIDRKKLGGKGGHGLVDLCELVLSEIDPKDYQLLQKLQEHVVWLGKYVTPMDASPLYDEALMDIIRNSSADEQVRLRSLFERLLATVPGESK